MHENKILFYSDNENNIKLNERLTTQKNKKNFILLKTTKTSQIRVSMKEN